MKKDAHWKHRQEKTQTTMSSEKTTQTVREVSHGTAPEYRVPEHRRTENRERNDIALRADATYEYAFRERDRV